MKAAELRVDMISFCPPECPEEAVIVCDIIADQIESEYLERGVSFDM